MSRQQSVGAKNSSKFLSGKLELTGWEVNKAFALSPPITFSAKSIIFLFTLMASGRFT